MNKRAFLLMLVLWLAFRTAASAYYDPHTQTFLSRDPIREAGGINLYAYCGNDPVGKHDPIGLSIELNLDGTATFYDDSYGSFRGMQDYFHSPLGIGEFVLQKANEELGGLNRAADYLGEDESHRLLVLQAEVPRLQRFVTYERNRVAAASQFGDTLAAEMAAARNTPGWSWLGLEGEIADIRAIGIGIGAIKNPRFGDYFTASLNSPFAYSRAVTLGIGIGLSLTGLPEESLVTGRTLNTYGDALRESLGPGRLSHADEWMATLAKAEDMGVTVVPRPGTMAFEPAFGEPGRLLIDPDASMGALRHEFQHIVDDAALGYPGLRVIADSNQFWSLEYRGYMQEINMARSIRDFGSGRSILLEMRQRRMDILGR